MNSLRPMLLTSLKSYDRTQFVKDVTAGIIVAIIALPLSIALALASGVGPEAGIFTAIVAGFVISALSGSSVQIAGPTAAFATIVAGIVAKDGLDGLVISTILAGIFLILMGVIDLRIPGTYILTFVVFIVLFGGHLTSGDLGQFVVQEVCGGGLILGAFFMATDYVTSPITPKGKIIYGIICGCLLGIFRMFGASAEGCSYSIIFANMLVPLIERFTIPKPFGKGGEK